MKLWNRVIKRNNLNKTAFTLAEVLITLGIIGVVASLTIPTLMNSYQNAQYVTALKKVYSVLNQAFKQMAADNGCAENLKCTGLFASGGMPDVANQYLGEELIKYLKVAKNCGVITNLGCFPADTNQNYDGSATKNFHRDNEPSYKIITVDGMSITVNSIQANCETDYSTGASGNMSQVCGWVYIDVNGLKGPNCYGRDTYRFFITNGKGALLYPEGGVDDNHSGNYWWNYSDANLCSPANKDGRYCAGRIIEKGWQMDY